MEAGDRKQAHVELVPLADDDREQFVRDNQEAFNYGALEEFGCRDDTFEEDGQIISRETILESIAGGEAYRIVADGEVAGGVVVRVEGDRGDLELLFVSPHIHSHGVGQAAWWKIEQLYPDVRVWELVTPYFETRNIHFYVNKLGFHIVEFYNSHHPDPNDPDGYGGGDDVHDGMFRFEKVIRR
jgi:GNAT superfamily N-acetyltransferase